MEARCVGTRCGREFREIEFGERREREGFNKLILETRRAIVGRMLNAANVKKSVTCGNWRQVKETGGDRMGLQIVSHCRRLRLSFACQVSCHPFVTNFECANVNIFPDGISGRVINRKGEGRGVEVGKFEFKNRY